MVRDWSYTAQAIALGHRGTHRNGTADIQSRRSASRVCRVATACLADSVIIELLLTGSFGAPSLTEEHSLVSPLPGVGPEGQQLTSYN